MYRPATRALAVLELLQTHRRISGAEIAQRLGVDGRTVRRYIAALEELGIPITAERGRYGAYLLVAGYKLPPMMFTDDEALALSVGLLAARSLGLTEASAAVASAQAKLERVMPERLMVRTRAVADTVMLDMARTAAASAGHTLFALSAAAQQCQRVRLRYRAKDGSETDQVLYGTYTHEWTRTADGWRIRSLRFESRHGRGTFLPPDEIKLFPAGGR